ncbi:MAG: hypothetical protein CL678_12115 [Bdellovibrionaceae bacterium]|nr:hypothetical protein [Pseudobdellovibrionaceae bacterium]|tara:strand:- start:450 stop:1154 length:705 start_codon:yes stop_codon:yes gene_type:complete
MKKGSLTLVPTPINDEAPLEPIALNYLKKIALNTNHILLVEEPKVMRKKWLDWNLPREAIDSFEVYNEHHAGEKEKKIISKLKEGFSATLLSDCGLPAFCDPGQTLVDLCHKNKIKVTATPFSNSISLAVALSGFPHHNFLFLGFAPQKTNEFTPWIKEGLKKSKVVIFMDTPYRLEKTIQKLIDSKINAQLFLGIDLNMDSEILLRGKIHNIESELSGLTEKKREFIAILYQP